MPIFSFCWPPYKAFHPLSDWPCLWQSPCILVSSWTSMFPGFCVCSLFFVRRTNDARCILSLQNAFVQLSLAFRNDNYTLDTRLKQAERERNLTEENTEKELEEFKNSLKVSLVGGDWPHIPHRARVLNLLIGMQDLPIGTTSRPWKIG